MGCSTISSCLNTYPAITWGLIGVLVLITLWLFVSLIRNVFLRMKMDLEEAAQRAEEYRENEALSRRLWRAIRIDEEWNRDVTQLRQIKDEVDFRRKAARTLEHQVLLIFSPFVPIALVCIILALLPFEWTKLIAVAIGFLEGIWTLVQYGRFRWLRHQVRQVLLEFQQQRLLSSDAGLNG